MELKNKIKLTAFQALAHLRIPRFQFQLAKLYHGTGALRNPELAVKWCELAASRAYAPAEVLMGQFHVSGFGVPCDQYEIFRWFERAAGHGDVNGIHQVAWCYQQGIGVIPSAVQAFRLWLEAASLGLPASQVAVAECFYRGIGTQKNLQKAQLWCRQAVQNGADSSAKSLLLRIDKELAAPLSFKP